MVLSQPSAALADCACKSQRGGIFQLGERTCISVNGKSYLAECEMNLNITSWKKVQDECPLASLEVIAGSIAKSL